MDAGSQLECFVVQLHPVAALDRPLRSVLEVRFLPVVLVAVAPAWPRLLDEVQPHLLPLPLAQHSVPTWTSWSPRGLPMSLELADPSAVHFVVAKLARMLLERR